MSPIETASYLIKQNHHLTLATATPDGKPWSTVVYFSFDEPGHLYWVSARNAVHSYNIRANPRVAITIFGPLPPDNRIDGLYVDATATELSDPAELKRPIEIMHRRPQLAKFTIKSLADVTGSASWRVYKAEPRQLFVRADAVDQASGQAITVRQPIAKLSLK